jgi:hypothetical protein
VKREGWKFLWRIRRRVENQEKMEESEGESRNCGEVSGSGLIG